MTALVTGFSPPIVTMRLRRSHHVLHQIDLLRLARPAARRSAPVIAPSRMTRMVWLSPIVSSSVSEVSTIATPSAESVADQLVDLLLGADIEAARRMIEDQDARVRRQPACEHDLLLVAAAEIAADLARAGGADAKPPDPLLRESLAPGHDR